MSKVYVMDEAVQTNDLSEFDARTKTINCGDRFD